MPCSVNSVGHGVTHRLQRLSPDVALQYKEWTIPVNVGQPTMILRATVHTSWWTHVTS